MPPPKGPIVIANKHQNNSTNKNQNQKGLLNVSPAAIQQQSTPTPAKSTVRLKLEVRRLPPALTKDEFLDAFGDEWKPMTGKVDWFQYRPGKIRGPAKVSEQSRAYFHLVNESHIKPFEAKFLSITFQDAKGSHKDPDLKHLQPMLEFAPNQRVPVAKQRADGRQGTIDQDPEYMSFLERETQPVTKPPSLETLAAEKPQEKVSSTPLLDHLREKKANKAKSSSSSKPSKSGRGDAKEEKPDSKSSTSASTPASASAPTPSIAKSSRNNQKTAQATKDAVKAANKQAAKATSAASQPPAPTPVTKSEKQPAAPPATSSRKRGDRVTPNAIKTMLQRDLGIAPVGGKRGSKAAAAATAAAASTTETASAASQSRAATPTVAESSPAAKPESTPKAAKQPRNRKGGNAAEKSNGQPPAQDGAKPTPPTPTGILKKSQPAQSNVKSAKSKANAQNGTQQAPATPSQAQPTVPSKPAKSTPQPSAGATKAYLKHANASQGITEPLIIAALANFGEVVKVDIDKRKGTALAEFKTHDGLKAAMAKRSVPVGQGAIELLEFRERPAQAGGRAANNPARSSGGSTRGKGRSGRGNGGAVANANGNAAGSSTPASPAPAKTATPAPADAT